MLVLPLKVKKISKGIYISKQIYLSTEELRKCFNMESVRHSYFAIASCYTILHKYNNYPLLCRLK